MRYLIALVIVGTAACNSDNVRAVPEFMGPKGDKGDIGDIGPAGPIGPQGEKGEVGSIGPQGPQGPQGEKGDRGDIGPAGPIGLTGPSGPQGPRGIDGAHGPQGPAGANGAVGPQGPKGSDGARGPQGPAGPTGANGPQGPAGESPVIRSESASPNCPTGGVSITFQGVTYYVCNGRDGKDGSSTISSTFIPGMMPGIINRNASCSYTGNFNTLACVSNGASFWHLLERGFIPNSSQLSVNFSIQIWHQKTSKWISLKECGTSTVVDSAVSGMCFNRATAPYGYIRVDHSGIIPWNEFMLSGNYWEAFDSGSGKQYTPLNVMYRYVAP